MSIITNHNSVLIRTILHNNILIHNVSFYIHSSFVKFYISYLFLRFPVCLILLLSIVIAAMLTL